MDRASGARSGRSSARGLGRIRLALAVLAGLALLTDGCAKQLACVGTPQSGTLGLIPGVFAPEDVEYIPTAGTVIVSQNGFRGRYLGKILALDPTLDLPTPRVLWPAGTASDYGSPDPTADPACDLTTCERGEAPSWFDPHGIASATRTDGTTRVVAVDHGRGRETIDLFDLAGRGSDVRLTWRGCLQMPHGARGNDVAVAANGDVVVGDYGTTRTQAGAMLGSGARRTVWRWRATEQRWEPVAGSTPGAPNGALIDGDAVVYSDSALGDVVRVDRQGDRVAVPVGGLPDNLSRDRDGRVLVATHLSLGRFFGCLLGGPCHSPWALVSVAFDGPEKDRALCVLRNDGATLGAVSSAATDGRRYWLGAVFGDRLGVWTPDAAALP